MYTAGSFFSGIGGLDLAFSRAGFDVLFQVEIEPYCRAVLTKHAPQHWPNAFQLEDIKDAGRHNLPTADVYFGGFPCQNISTAGRGEGIKEGNRSGLWFEFARIIGELRPRFVFLENVPAVTSRGGTIVIAQLASMGYGAEWGVIPASSVGAPHRRARWYCVAYRNGGRSVREGVEVQSGRHTTDACCPASRETGMAYGDSERKPQPQGTQSDFGRRTEYGSEEGLGYATSEGLSFPRSAELPAPDTQVGTRLVAEFERTSGTPVGVVGDSNRTGREGRRDGAEPISPTFAGIVNTGSPELADANGTGSGSLRGEEEIQIESLLGRAVDGLPRQLDRTRWPARPGEEQYVWEAPRTITGKIPNRAARLKALGNAVVPAVIQPFAEAIYEALEKQSIEGDFE